MKTPALDSVLFASRTEKGFRDENQDAMTDFDTPFGQVYLVADGMGGVQGGAVASLMTAECFRKYLRSFSPSLSIGEALQRTASATNSEIRLRAGSGDPSVVGMGSTVVLAVLASTGDRFAGTIAHIGDSRAYLLRQGSLTRLTRDHSTVQALVDNNQITAEEALNHPDANVITRALGPHSETRVELSEHSFETGDTLMLCTDGLCGFVEDATIGAELAMPRTAAETADALISLALASGSTDNITVQIMQFAETKQTATGKTLRQVFKRPIPAARESKPSGKVRFRVFPLLGYVGCFLAGLVLGLSGLLGSIGSHWRDMGRFTFQKTPGTAVSLAPQPAPPPCKPASVVVAGTVASTQPCTPVVRSTVPLKDAKAN